MLLTIKVKLNPSEEQRVALFSVMERFNAACNHISGIAFPAKTFNRARLHHLTYYDVRKEYGLSAQLAVRAIAKVADSYRSTMSGIRERNNIHRARGEPIEVLERIVFKKYGAVVYDPRIMTIKPDAVSLTTLDGRMTIPFAEKVLEGKKPEGEADLIYVREKFYLCVIIDVPDALIVEPEGFLGVDLGIVNIATTSDGIRYSGEECDRTRKRYMAIRAALQSAGTKSAKRHLKLIAGRERRFKVSVNHVISRRIVQAAKDTKRGIALEDLQGIRERTTVMLRNSSRHDQRERHSKWAFRQLRSFFEYKAKIAGVVVKLIDPAFTSQQCSECGCIDSGNRHGQAFCCVECGHTENADTNAAKNIQQRAGVNLPIVVRRIFGYSSHEEPTS